MTEIHDNSANWVERILVLENQIQELKLAISEKDKRISILDEQIRAIKDQETILARETSNVHVEGIFRDIASPISQLMTQMYICEKEQKMVPASDIFRVVKNLIHSIEKHGLVIDCAPGEQVRYDPAKHAALDAATSLSTGQSTNVRLAGISYRGKILSKAMVSES